jgi:hypothetical protein
LQKTIGYAVVSQTERRRAAKNYDGTALTTHHVGSLLQEVLQAISSQYQERPDLLLATWPEIIGPKLAGMTQALSFADGVLKVKVSNSTLHSLLSRHDKYRILAAIQQKFPKIKITNIVFKIA